MPVTQQLVRLDAQEFSSNLESDEFDRVFSFVGVDKKRYLDLGWDASYFIKLLLFADGSNSDLCKMLEGLNKFDFESDVFEQPLYLNISEVNDLVEKAREVDVIATLDAAPKNLDELNALLGSDYSEYPDKIFKESWASQLAFYEAAKSEQQLVLIWWD